MRWVAIAIALFGSTAIADPRTYETSPSTACTPVPASAEEITSTAAASDTSTQLTSFTRYWLRCDTAAYIDSSTTTCTAASGDWKLPADTIVDLLTTDTIRYFCARSVTTDGSCWLLKCQ